VMAQEHRSGMLEDISGLGSRAGVAGAMTSDHRPEFSSSPALDRRQEPGRDLPRVQRVSAPPCRALWTRKVTTPARRV
jgi:hypothetical protein